VKDFDLSFVRGLSLEDGAATLTEYTSEILCNFTQNCTGENEDIIISGGGRKNRFLVKNIQKKINSSVKLIDDLGVDGDFVESQAFAYLAIRSYLNLPISFPETTGVREPCTGGIIVKNF
jgi:anhydro-N-acetylmuramic acid kinase